MTEQLQVRVHWPEAQPTVVYLPGLHGDWTLVGSFRQALRGRARFVEMTYPRTLTWTLEDYTRAVENALLERGITSGWVLAESFGSQVVWRLAAGKRFQVEGVILAGGFVRHPVRWGVRLAQRLAGDVSLTLLTKVLFGYAKIARFRYRHAPEVLVGIKEFLARRTELDRQAAVHRLHLVAESDPCALAREVQVPVYALTGLWDPVVPWFWVRRWLKKNCSQLRNYKIIWRADHNVLGTAPDTAAEVVVGWITA